MIFSCFSSLNFLPYSLMHFSHFSSLNYLPYSPIRQPLSQHPIPNNCYAQTPMYVKYGIISLSLFSLLLSPQLLCTLTKALIFYLIPQIIYSCFPAHIFLPYFWMKQPLWQYPIPNNCYAQTSMYVKYGIISLSLFSLPNSPQLNCT